MATQHPDNASLAPFCGKHFVSNTDEITECYQCFSELGVQEYMWDWEGKFVDEAVIDRLFQTYHDFFTQHQLGRDIFLTFRVPNIWEEPSHRLPRAFMNMISAEHAAEQLGVHKSPLFEVILPMTSRADQLIYLQHKFQKIADATEEIFEMPSHLKHIDVIPLFEEVETMADANNILAEYVDFLKAEYQYKPEYLRVFIARSDPALNAGLLP
ncbi:MAG TPA: phosphoenolpyruvate carboxylase, partial [Candidatus Gracilibacteria bacterium]